MGQVHNSVEYAVIIVATVRGYYGEANETTPGDETDIIASTYFKKVHKGLKKLAPTRRMHRFSILQQHSRKVREKINMDESRDRMLWALWLTQWKGVCMKRNLLRPSAERRGRGYQDAMGIAEDWRWSRFRLRRASGAVNG